MKKKERKNKKREGSIKKTACYDIANLLLPRDNKTTADIVNIVQWKLIKPTTFERSFKVVEIGGSHFKEVTSKNELQKST